MGPSVKFDSANKDLIFRKIWGSIIFSGNCPNIEGGSSEGGLAKDYTFSLIKRIDFEIGPSVKFVSPKKGLISKKNWGKFFSGKMAIPYFRDFARLSVI